MRLSAQSHSSMMNAIKKALGRYISEKGMSIVTDIHLQPVQDSGDLIIYNDDEEELSRAFIQDWLEYKEDDFYAQVESLLRNELVQLREDGLFDSLCIMKPYSFVLVDEEKETVVELLLMDDEDTVLISGELLKGLDEELDAFLKDLLER